MKCVWICAVKPGPRWKHIFTLSAQISDPAGLHLLSYRRPSKSQPSTSARAYFYSSVEQSSFQSVILFWKSPAAVYFLISFFSLYDFYCTSAMTALLLSPVPLTSWVFIGFACHLVPSVCGCCFHWGHKVHRESFLNKTTVKEAPSATLCIFHILLNQWDIFRQSLGNGKGKKITSK